jgi:hypothetical protein
MMLSRAPSLRASCSEHTRGGNWRDHACRHADPQLFFPLGTSGPAQYQVEQAVEICRACPVQA